MHYKQKEGKNSASCVKPCFRDALKTQSFVDQELAIIEYVLVFSSLITSVTYCVA